MHTARSFSYKLIVGLKKTHYNKKERSRINPLPMKNKNFHYCVRNFLEMDYYYRKDEANMEVRIIVSRLLHAITQSPTFGNTIASSCKQNTILITENHSLLKFLRRKGKYHLPKKPCQKQQNQLLGFYPLLYI